jgi:hypothetical protein
MSFLGNLAKGFIRSAVNQVGRDGGKVISNNVYGDKHTTPIRNTNNQIQNFITENNSQTIDRADLLKEGFKEELMSNSIIMNIFVVVGSFALPILGSLYWTIIGLINLFKKNTKFYIYKQQAVYKSDRRYSSGKRLEGYQNVKAYSIHKIIATKSERIIYFTKSIIALGLAYLTFNFWYQVYTNWNSSEEINIEMQNNNKIAIARNFIDLQKEPFKESEKLESIYTSDTLNLLNELKKDSDSVTIWYKVKHNDQTGWVYNKKDKERKN